MIIPIDTACGLREGAGLDDMGLWYEKYHEKTNIAPRIAKTFDGRK
jgi:hypothetical protein